MKNRFSFIVDVVCILGATLSFLWILAKQDPLGYVLLGVFLAIAAAQRAILSCRE
jgi:hypothetical protein